MTGSDVHVAHGYTMEDLRQITAAALVADRLLAMPYSERHDIAWSAIAEHVCAADEPPLRQELVRVGWQAIYHHIRDGLRQRGWSDGERDRSTGMPTMPRFATYWHGTRVESPQEDRLVEELAVTQVLATLSPAKREAIVALAVHDDYRLAAASLGIAYEALLQRLKMARAQVLNSGMKGKHRVECAAQIDAWGPTENHSPRTAPEGTNGLPRTPALPSTRYEESYRKGASVGHVSAPGA